MRPDRGLTSQILFHKRNVHQRDWRGVRAVAVSEPASLHEMHFEGSEITRRGVGEVRDLRLGVGVPSIQNPDSVVQRRLEWARESHSCRDHARDLLDLVQ